MEPICYLCSTEGVPANDKFIDGCVADFIKEKVARVFLVTIVSSDVMYKMSLKSTLSF